MRSYDELLTAINANTDSTFEDIEYWVGNNVTDDEAALMVARNPRIARKLASFVETNGFGDWVNVRKDYDYTPHDELRIGISMYISEEKKNYDH